MIPPFHKDRVKQLFNPCENESFPQVAGINTSIESVATSSHTVNLPANISAGDLLIVFFTVDADRSVMDWDGFTELFNMSNAANVTLLVAYKKATGSEGISITVVTDVADNSVHISFRIICAEDPDTQAPEVSTGATARNANPDPDLLTPTGGAKNYLWIATYGYDRAFSPSVYPLPDNNTEEGIGVGVAACSDELNQDSLDPGTFTVSTVDEWVACTIAVHPVAVME